MLCTINPPNTYPKCIDSFQNEKVQIVFFYFEDARPSENLIIRPYPIDGEPGNVCVLGLKRSGVISIFVHQKHSFRSRKTAQDIFPGSIVSVGLEALKTLNMSMLAITEQDVHRDSERRLMN